MTLHIINSLADLLSLLLSIGGGGSGVGGIVFRVLIRVSQGYFVFYRNCGQNTVVVLVVITAMVFVRSVAPNETKLGLGSVGCPYMIMLRQIYILHIVSF